MKLFLLFKVVLLYDSGPWWTMFEYSTIKFSIKNQSILKRINSESYVFLNIYGGNGLKL